MTEKRILECTEEELARLAGEVLAPEFTGHYDDRHQSDGCYCTKCHQKMYEIAAPTARYTDAYNKPCPIPDPIPITPDNAFKYRDWAVDEDRLLWMGGKYAVYRHFTGRQICPDSGDGEWFEDLAQPHHFIRAACICKIRSERKEE